jgi:hypothetical protein
MGYLWLSYSRFASLLSQAQPPPQFGTFGSVRPMEQGLERPDQRFTNPLEGVYPVPSSTNIEFRFGA